MKTFQEDEVKGCVPAMGYSFASGTTDGANTLNITQVSSSTGDLIMFLCIGFVTNCNH